MNNKLIIVEGLPGSGKIAVLDMINNYLLEKDVDTNFFPEGDLGHPADFDGVAF